jgi:hypothetical protein
VLAGAFALACILRIVVLAYASELLAGVLSVLGWSYYWRRLAAYRSFMQQIMFGLQREDDGIVHQVGDTQMPVDGIECISIRMLSGDPEVDAAGGRQLYYDCAKLPFPLPVGTRVHLTTTGYFIKRMETLEER